MSSASLETLTQDWGELLLAFQPDIMDKTSALVDAHQDMLASYFYEQMLSDPVASQFLSHEQVKNRLHGSMKRWVSGLFALRAGHDMQQLVAFQSHIGEVHARVEVPVHVVLRGARALKRKSLSLLRQDASFSETERLLASQYISMSIDLAMEIMSNAYSSSHDRNARAEESYRLFSVAQNLAAEKERQRAALLDWENQLMFDRAIGLDAAHLPRIGAAEFGLWFRHKGAHAFQGAAETEQILQAMQYIDDVLLPASDVQAEDNTQRVRRLRDLRERTKSIGYHLDRLFEQHNELESGRDALTRLLSRKFLSVVLSKEVNYARTTGTTFALLAIDLDHFKQVNDRHGHEAGDMVLQQFAMLVNNSTRGGDYAFRLGGEEFLLLLVDISPQSALRVANTLRAMTESESFRLPQDRETQMTVSIGLAMHDGHPDYLRTMRRADAALYEAKRAGRNRVEVAE